MSVAPAVQLDFFVGLDIGKVRDPAALCVLERRREFTPGPFNPAAPEATAARYSYGVRHLERLKLGTPYPAVVARAAAVCEAIPPAGRVAELVVDITGVGRPIFDLLRAREDLRRSGVRIVGVHYTAGAAPSSAGSDSCWNVPKRDIVAGLVVLFQAGELRIAERLEDRIVLMNELVNFQEKVTAAGRATFGNGGDAEHDDYVNAAGLAAWRARVRPAGPQDRRLL